MRECRVSKSAVSNTINTGLKLSHSYSQELCGLYVPTVGDKAPDPKIIVLNTELANALGLDVASLNEAEIAALLSGGYSPTGFEPFAQAYAGHQFGGFSPQLGDGRALLLAEVIAADDQRFDIHLKGSGRTVFSRRGDGKAVIGPVLREYILGEAMHRLGVPTTRALAVTCTGESIMRDRMLPGAVLARVASSHIRVGTFQFVALKGDLSKLKVLADYAIERHYPQLQGCDNPYLSLLESVCHKQALLMAQWMSIGFVHGVMNTDNITISGETIDYGPCAFLDAFDPSAVFSSIDTQGRYAYAKQPSMALWGMTRFAETLLPVLADDEDSAVALATTVLNAFEADYQQQWLELMRQKLAFSTHKVEDLALINELLGIMVAHAVDYTLLFRALADWLQGQHDSLKALLKNDEVMGSWLGRWSVRLQQEEADVQVQAANMNQVNALYIPRNHLVESVIEAAEQNQNYALFKALLKVLEKPFEKRPGLGDYALAAPPTFGNYKTFCGT